MELKKIGHRNIKSDMMFIVVIVIFIRLAMCTQGTLSTVLSVCIAPFRIQTLLQIKIGGKKTEVCMWENGKLKNCEKAKCKYPKFCRTFKAQHSAQYVYVDPS